MKKRDQCNAVLGGAAPKPVAKAGDQAWRVVDESLPGLIARARLGSKCPYRRNPGPSGVLVVNLPACVHDPLLGQDAEIISKVRWEFHWARAAVTSYNWRRRKLEEAGHPPEDAARFLHGKHHAWAAPLEQLDFDTIHYLTQQLRACSNTLGHDGHVIAARGRN